MSNHWQTKDVEDTKVIDNKGQALIRHYFTLDSAKVTDSFESADTYYAWTPGGKNGIIDQVGKKIADGVLIPLPTWDYLRGLTITDKPFPWTKTLNGEIPGARDINGDSVNACFWHNKIGKKPTTKTIDDLFFAGQNASDDKKETVIKATKESKVGEVCKIQFLKKNGAGQMVLEEGWGIKQSITLDQTLYPVGIINADYFKLRNADFKALGPTGKIVPHAAYISKVWYDAVQSGEYKWVKDTENQLVVRSETGNLCVINCATAAKLEDKDRWKIRWDNGTKVIDSDGAWSRRINPEIELCIHPMGNTRLTSKQLYDLFDKVLGENEKIKQKYTKASDTSDFLKDYTLLSISPFGDYATFIAKKTWVSYLDARPDRPWPRSLENITDAIKDLEMADPEDPPVGQCSPYSLQHNPLSLSKIRRAAGTRKDALDQGGVMGTSATAIANVLQWLPANERIAAAGIWPGTGNMPAEWLHRSAYSWGGLCAANESAPFSSQVKENLIFGSSECNSVMTRYEKAFQELFSKEAEFRAKQSANQGSMNVEDNLTGTLTTFIGTMALDSTPDYPYRVQHPKGTPEDWPVWNRKVPWLGFHMRYQMILDQHSKLLGPATIWGTSFYPFQRGFYTMLESEVDLAMFDYLAELMKKDHGGTEEKQPKEPEEIEQVVHKDENPIELEGLYKSHMNIEEEIETNKIKPMMLFSLVPTPDILLSATQIGTTGTQVPAEGQGLLETRQEVFTENSSTIPESQASTSTAVSFIKATSSTPPSAYVALWAAICSGQPTITVDGIILTTPTVSSLTTGTTREENDNPAAKIGLDKQGNGIPLQEDKIDLPTTPIPPPEFLVKGDVTLYGLTIPGVKLSSIQSAQPQGIAERVSFPDTLTLGKLVEDFKGSFLDDIVVKNTYFSYHSYTRGSKQPGLRLHTELSLTGPLQPVQDLLTTVFDQSTATLTVNGYISRHRDWVTPLVPVGFTLTGSLLRLNVELFGVVHITDVGVDIIAHKVMMQTGLGYECRYGFWGGAGIKVPGSVMPLMVQWRLEPIMDKGRSMTLVSKDESWTDVLGVKGLDLANVQFGVQWEEGATLDTLDVMVRGTLKLSSTGTLVVQGSYSKSNGWLLSCDFEEADLVMIEEIYSELFGARLTPVDAAHDVEFRNLKLVIGRASGLVLEGEATVNGYTSASATISLTSAGLEIKGSIDGDVVLDGGSVTIKQAALDVFVGAASSNTGRPIRVQVSGDVVWGTLEFNAGLFVDNFPGAGEAQWTVYGTMKGDLQLQLSHLTPALRGHPWLDIDIMQVAFIASNQDNVTEQVPNKFKYPVKKGVQVFATVQEGIIAVNGVTKTKSGGLTLCVVEGGESLKIKVSLPQEQKLILSNNIKSDGLCFEIVVSDSPHVLVSAGLEVRVASQSKPLELTFSLEAGDSTAAGKGTMKTDWKDPFGLSPNLTISNILLDIEINYETFPKTGIPSKLEFGGNIAVGGADATVDIVLSEIPTEELISAEITNVDLVSLFTVGTTVAAASSSPSSPAPSTITAEHNEILKLKDLFLYFSKGATVAGIVRPPGISFDCTLDLFGHTAKVNATLAEQIAMSGSIDPFALGPVTVRGLTGPTAPATVNVAVGPVDNHIKIDGVIDLCALTIGVSTSVEVSPQQSFNFVAKVAFAEALEFDLMASMSGELAGGGTEELEFDLTAEMHQDIIVHIIKAAQDHFIAVNTAVQNSYAEKEKELDAKEASYKIKLQAAEDWVNAKKAEADAKRAAVNKAFDDRKGELEREKGVKDKELQGIKQKLEDAVRKAENDLEQTKADVAKALQAATVAIETAARVGEVKIEEWKKNVAAEQAALNVVYGNFEADVAAAESRLKNAQDNANAKQAQINDMNGQINNAGFWDRMRLYWDVVELEVEKDALAATVWVAEKAVELGNDVVKTAYVDAQSVLAKAQSILTNGEADIAEDAKRLELDLQNAQQDADKAIDEGTKAIIAVANGALKLAFDAAQKDLNMFMDAMVGAIGDVQAAVDEVEKSGEFVVYKLAIMDLEVIKNNIKRLDPERMALNLEEGTQKTLAAVLKEALDLAGNVLDVEEVKMSGGLRALKDGSKPLSVTLMAKLGGERKEFTCSYRPGGIEEFFNGLWEDVCRKL